MTDTGKPARRQWVVVTGVLLVVVGVGLLTTPLAGLGFVWAGVGVLLLVTEGLLRA